MALAEFLDNQKTQQTASRTGNGPIPTSLGQKISALGQGRDWVITVQEFPDSISVQINFTTPPPPAAG